MEQKSKVDFIEQLRKNWFVVLFIGGIVVGWTNIQSDLKVTEKDIAEVKVDMVAANLRIDGYQKQVSDISGDIKAIKESLSFIKDKIK